VAGLLCTIEKRDPLCKSCRGCLWKAILKNDNDETVIYEKYGSNLRRRVNFTGHEIVLQNVDQYIFSLQRNAVKVTVKHLNGKVQSFIGYSLINRDISA
jgi:competence protein ComGF